MTGITIASVSREAKTLILGKENPEMRISQPMLSEISTSLLVMKASTMMIHLLISQLVVSEQRSVERLRPPLIELETKIFAMYRVTTSVVGSLKDSSSIKVSTPE
jgi:hypothetical protein